MIAAHDEYGTGRVMEHPCRDAAEQRAPDWAPAVRPDDEESRVERLDRDADLLDREAAQHDGARLHVGLLRAGRSLGVHPPRLLLAQLRQLAVRRQRPTEAERGVGDVP